MITFKDFLNEEFTKNVNSIDMIHYTTDKIAELILESDFKESNNSMYGQGIYFTDSKLPFIKNKYEVGIKVSLKKHKQLYIDKDYDIFNIISDELNIQINNATKIKELCLDNNIKSLRINRDDEIYTLIFDTSIIKEKTIVELI